MNIVTPEFVDRMLESGPLAEAWRRTRGGTADPSVGIGWGKSSTWELICEEILDTEHDIEWYEGIITELVGRGFRFEQIAAMRRFAWNTAGWLNFDKML